MTARESKGPRLFVTNVRFFSADSLGTSLLLSPEDSHYIADVLRLRVGDPLEIGDSSGTIARAHVTAFNESVSVTIDEILPGDTRSRPEITLLCALCKGQKNDLICDWATELGCSTIIFWQATRSIVRVNDQKDCHHKETRLSKIALAAAQQSKQNKPPVVRVTRSLAEAVQLAPRGDAPGTTRVVCSLSAQAIPLAEIVSNTSPLTNVTLVIGPEGDITLEEEAFLVPQGFVPASLGTNVLRSELAVVSALARLL